MPEHPDPARVETLFDQALSRPAAERSQFLDRECAGDRELLAEVRSLLAAHERAGDGPLLDASRAAKLLAASREPAPGQLIGPYRLVTVLGRGGMGTVYLAERVAGGFEQQVALKLVKRGMDSEAVLRRFEHERQILARLAHPGIAHLLEGGISADGRPWFAMEVVTGEPITVWAERRGLALTARIELFIEVCAAIQEAHRNLVVHCDLKPSNILVNEAGRPKLLDFGIAKLLAPDEEGDPLTHVGDRALTPAYAAPEQVRGEPISTASDVYALGVVLYELLVGRSPYPAESSTPEQLRRMVCETEPTTASVAARRVAGGEAGERLSRRLRGDLDAILAQALSKESHRRYSSVEAFAEDLSRHLAGRPIAARPPSATYRAGKFLRRHAAGAAAAAVVLVALLGGLVATTWQARIATAEARKALEVQEFLTSLLQSVDPYQTGGAPWTAEELLDRGVERIETAALDPEIEAALLGVLGGVSRSLGQLERAESLWRRSVEIRRDHPGPGSSGLAESQRGLASALVDLDQTDAAAALFEEALAIQRRRIARTDRPAARRALARTLGERGVLLYLTEHLEESEAAYREALTLFETLPGDHRAEIAQIETSLGSIARERGDLEAAEHHLRTALAAEQHVLGPRHAEVATTMGHLAWVRRERGDYEEAERLYRDALAIARETLPGRHPSITTKISNLAVMLRSLGRYAEAAELFREVLALDREQLGEGHPYVAFSLDNLGATLTELGAFEEALALFDRAHAILVEPRGADSVAAATNRAATAEALVLSGEPAEALALLEAARSVFSSQLGANHPREANALTTMGAALAALGRDAESETRYREALAMHRSAGRMGHPDAVRTLVDLGQLLERAGLGARAFELLRDASLAATASLPEHHWLRCSADRAFAEELGRSGASEEAAKIAERAHACLQAAEGIRADRLRRRTVEPLAGALPAV